MSEVISDLRRPVVALDASAVNWLYDDGKREARLAVLRTSFFPRVPFTTLDEIAATPDRYKRRQLVEMVLRLQDAGDCVLPFHQLLTNHVRSYAVESEYDWNGVDFSGTRLKESVLDFRRQLTDELASAQRAAIRSTEVRFKNMFETARRKLAEMFEDQDVWTLEQFIQLIFKKDGSYWKTAAGLMNRALTYEAEESGEASSASSAAEFDAAQAEEFASRCPVFKAMLLGIARSEFALAHDPSQSRETRRRWAGRIDTYSSLYLPYCRLFLTADRGQFDCLSFVAQELGGMAEVVRYEQFWERLADPSFSF